MAIILNIGPCGWGKCNFCSYNKREKFYTPTIQELLQLMRKELKDAIKENRYFKIFNGGSWFADEVPVQMRSLMYRFLVKNNYKWLRVENRVDRVNWGEVKVLIDRGFDLTISWGIEVLDNEALKFLNKGITVEQILETLVTATESKVKNMIYLLVGYPGYKKEDLIKSIKFLEEHIDLWDELCTLTYVPMIGSVFYEDYWRSNKLRVISKDVWRECREYIRNKFLSLDKNISFETYHWRYIHGKTYEELYKKKA